MLSLILRKVIIVMSQIMNEKNATVILKSLVVRRAVCGLASSNCTSGLDIWWAPVIMDHLKAWNNILGLVENSQSSNYIISLAYVAVKSQNVSRNLKYYFTFAENIFISFINLRIQNIYTFVWRMLNYSNVCNNSVISI